MYNPRLQDEVRVAWSQSHTAHRDPTSIDWMFSDSDTKVGHVASDRVSSI